MTPVQANRVGAQQPMHPFDQIRVGGLQHQMKVVAHQTIGMHLPISLLTRLRQRFEKILPIHVIVVNVLAPIPATHHTCPAVALAKGMMDRSRIINS
jgi:hypothetical protein